MDEYNDNQDEYEESQGTDPRAWLEKLTRRYLGDVRIHDSQQAGELTRRLGARAFTVGRDIYVRPELMRPMTRRSASLLAHELYHVAEQTGSTSSPPDMPLFSPPAPGTQAAPTRGRAGSGFGSGSGSSDGMVQGGGGNMAVQRSAAPSSSEQGAESAEAAALRSPRIRRASRKPPPPDPEELAERVYEMMAKDIMLDQERAAGM